MIELWIFSLLHFFVLLQPHYVYGGIHLKKKQQNSQSGGLEDEVETNQEQNLQFSSCVSFHISLEASHLPFFSFRQVGAVLWFMFFSATRCNKAAGVNSGLRISVCWDATSGFCLKLQQHWDCKHVFNITTQIGIHPLNNDFDQLLLLELVLIITGGGHYRCGSCGPVQWRMLRPMVLKMT